MAAACRPLCSVLGPEGEGCIGEIEQIADRKTESEALVRPGIERSRRRAHWRIDFIESVDLMLKAVLHATLLFPDEGPEDGCDARVDVARQVVQLAVRIAEMQTNGMQGRKAVRDYNRFLSDLLRDLFGNLYQPKPSLDFACRTQHALALAQSVYNDRTFGLLPILADALEDAGCTDANILDHLRAPGPHVRGCFALDLLLEKE
jgi:hypothetical protein